MKAAALYTAGCAAIAMASAGAIPLVVTPLGRLRDGGLVVDDRRAR